MPHQCTTCGRTFADGSKEMLSGCPDCGGNKFQFKPASPRARESDSTPATDDAADSDSAAEAGRPTPSDRSSTDAGDGPADTADSPPRPSSSPSRSSPPPSADPSSTADASADSAPSAPSQSTPPSETDEGTPPSETDDQNDAEVERRTDDARPPAEDHAQASARTDFVSPDELADAASQSRQTPESVDGRVIEPQNEDRPGLEELREELNSQFESIKIVSPGQYELNLMELYDRQEYIISLQEDGRYVIEVPGSWDDRGDD
ncbi:hypothetical protein C2R22_20885 [Salinigranum rubrum]|uniref:Origin-associated protein OapC n=1 Tax=Salinigranum rubrum TaxID=755307 RepID=A0A2I8VPG8_9EURY|nr:Zn-ribbon containing protein [Salinigranum rubrum]AUV83796.1 hypothetical protein C2R22_20885 [Salinigranum rubrum]